MKVRVDMKLSTRQWFLTLLLVTSSFLRVELVSAQADPVSEVIHLVNELRISNRLPAYTVDAALMSAAQAQASWSAANNHIGHDGPGGSTPNDRAQAAGYGGGELSFATENAGHGTIGYHTPSLVVTMWQSDWGHLNAMISPDYEHIGVGYAEAGGYSWYVMMVGWVGEKAGPSAVDPQWLSENSVPLSPFILSEPDAQGAIYHEVQPGQTAWTIAAYYDVDLSELLALNGLTQESVLHSGDRLLVRPPDSLPVSANSESATQTAAPQPEHATIEAAPTTTPSVTSEIPGVSTKVPLFIIIGSGLILLAIVGLFRSRIHRDGV
jgi:LysM repeat protein